MKYTGLMARKIETMSAKTKAAWVAFVSWVLASVAVIVIIIVSTTIITMVATRLDTLACQDLGRLNNLEIQMSHGTCYVHIGEYWIPSGQMGEALTR